MASIPRVTITVGVSAGGSSIPQDVDEEGLFMTYIQATRGDVRTQFIVIPPRHDGPGIFRVLERTQNFPGNRSKWIHSSKRLLDIESRMAEFQNRGWDILGGMVSRLEKDDYESMWDGNTSHKAIRAIDRAINAAGLEIK